MAMSRGTTGSKSTSGSSARQDRELVAHLRGSGARSPADYHRTHTLRYLHRYEMPPCPHRPATLPAIDDELIDEVREAKASGTRNRASLILLRRFGEWRGGVLRSEALAVGNVLLMFAVHRALVRDADHESAVRVARWIGTHYDTVPDADRDLAGDQKAAERACRRRDIMSDAVLLERKEQAWVPRDIEPEQEDFSWDGNI